VRIGNEVVLVNKDVIQHADTKNYSIRDYIITL
jgi:hypothetical protein